MIFKKLQNKALNLRKNTFLTFIKKKEAHLGGSFSMIEIIILLYELILKKNDKFILSKSHASIPLCLLLKEQGYNPKIATHLEKDINNGIYCTTGSLGHGLPISVGMAMARKLKKNKGKVYVLISDGECQEGTTWESLLIASKHNLSNLVIIVDYNKIQALTTLKEGLPLNNLRKKFESFNIFTSEVFDGHSFPKLKKGFMKIKNNKSSPSVIIIHTTKGKGITKFENDPAWHAKKIREKESIIGKKSLGIK